MQPGITWRIWSQRVVCIGLAVGMSVGDCVNHVDWHEKIKPKFGWYLLMSTQTKKKTWKEANLLLFACLTFTLAGEVIYPVDAVADSLADISLQASSQPGYEQVSRNPDLNYWGTQPHEPNNWVLSLFGARQSLLDDSPPYCTSQPNKPSFKNGFILSVLCR